MQKLHVYYISSRHEMLLDLILKIVNAIPMRTKNEEEASRCQSYPRELRPPACRAGRRQKIGGEVQ
jgi:hypothetical protein